MYRSLGELHAYAREAYAYFVRQTRGDGTDALTLSSSSLAAGLDRCGVECAVKVLFGTTLSDSQLSTLFPRTRHAATEDADNYDRPTRVDETTFLRFVTAYAEQHENDALQQQQTDHRIVPHGGGGTATPWSVTAWLLFEALAAGKGYITLQDLSAADVVSPFTSQAANRTSFGRGDAGSDATTTQQLMTSMDAQRRDALLSHVFAVLDRDHDGRLQFSDVRDYLAA